MKVLSTLIKRSAQHFHSLPCGVCAVFGNNGYIWLSQASDSDDVKSKAQKVPTKDNFERIARVRNAIVVLAKQFMLISAQSVMCVYNASVQAGLEPKVKRFVHMLLLSGMCHAVLVGNAGGLDA